MGFRLTCDLARGQEAERACEGTRDWGQREHKLQERCELSVSGVLGSRGHGAEAARVGGFPVPPKGYPSRHSKGETAKEDGTR